MKFAKPLAAGLFAAVLTFSLAHCGTNDKTGDTTPDSGTAAVDCTLHPEDPSCQCVTDSDCGDPATSICNIATNQCEPACTTKAQCQAHPSTGGAPLAQCAAGLGCNCDERRCVPQACTADSECGTQVCKSGACVAAEATADSCQVFPQQALLHVGQTATFAAVAYAGAKPVIPGAAAITWSAADASVTSKGAGVFEGATATAGGTATASVKATVNGKSCTAKVLVFGAPAANTGRAVVIDELTGLTVQGATVVWGTGNATEDATAKGVFTFANAPATATVSVFHKDYGYVTLINTGKKDLLIPLRHNTGKKAGGYKGKFTNLSTTSDAHFGIAGTSIPGSLTDLDLGVLVGPTQDTAITFSGSTYHVPLPSGVTLGLGANKFKENFQALGVAGTCDNEAEMRSGSCGTRSAWSVMGDIPVSKLPISQIASGGSNLNIGSLLTSLLPSFKTFKSGVVRDVPFKLKDIPAGKTASDLFPDDAAFTPQDLTPNVNLSLKQTVTVPKLPSAAGKPLDSALVLAGAIVKGRGVVPLGITAGVDTDDKNKTADGLVIGETGANDGKLTLRMAPNHDGTEGSTYGVATLAVSINSFSTGGGRLAIAGLMKTYGAIPYGTAVTYDSGFVAFADKISYNFRTGAFSVPAVNADSSIHRVIFRDDNENRWTVYYNEKTFTLPKPPAGFDDRTMADGTDRATSTGERGTIMAQDLAAKSGTTTIDMETAFEFNATNVDTLVEFTNAFSVYDYSRPGISFTDPKDGATGVPGNATFKITVSNFDIPAQGNVKVTSGGKTATITPGMNGEVSAQFSPGLPTGAQTVTATLVDSSGNPLDPAVSQTINVTIQ